MSSLSFTIVQTNLHWEDKAANLQMLENKIKSIGQKTEVVILPEMFSTGFSMKPELFAEEMNGRTVNWMKRVAEEKRVVITGSIMIKENGQCYNRLIWMLPNGQMGLYDKRHLFAYGHEDQHFKPGHRRLIASVKGWRINLLVCYDLRFPVWARQSTQTATNNQSLEYDVLVYVANWPKKRVNMWTALLKARAIENQCYCIGVNRVGTDASANDYNGHSMVISPLGEVLYDKADDEDIYTVTLQKDELNDIRQKMPFWKDADPFEIITDLRTK